MRSRRPARDGLGCFEIVVAAVLAALAVPVPGAAVESAENRLDVSLKLLDRAQKAAARTTGAFTVFCAQATGTVHFILDVNGYFQ